MNLTRTLGICALLTTLAFAQQTPTTNRTDSKTDLTPAATSLKEQFKLSNLLKKDASFQVAHQKPVVRRDPFQKQTPK